MKAQLWLVVMLSITVLSLNSLAETGESPEAPKPATNLAESSEVAVPALTEAELLQRQDMSGFYPSCQSVHGTFCSSPGTLFFWCQYQYGEPEVCLCQSNHTWRCP